MCRLLLLQNRYGVDPNSHLNAFRQLCKESREYQGHGWGCAWLNDQGEWKTHHNILPIWDDLLEFSNSRLFLVHARSAFRDEGIVVDNNMPFTDGERMFLFNGELQGVKIKVDGRIGAEKIFNTIRRFDNHDLSAATRRGVMVINKRTRYVRAMNFFLADNNQVEICSQFGETPDYFQLRKYRDNDLTVICSETYDLGNNQWQKIDNHSIHTLPLSL